MELAGRVVAITGASRGIGRAAAASFAEAGATLALIARSSPELERVARELGSARSLVVAADIGHRDAAPRVVDAVVDRFGKIDVLVNNAGIGLGGPGRSASTVDVERVLAVNFLGPLWLMQASIPSMCRHGGGLIVNVSSILGRRSTPWNGIYCASKAALEALVEALRVEHARDNVRFSTLYPGVTRTQFTDHSLGSTAGRRAGLRGVPASRVAAKLVRVARKEPRDAYVTFFDGVFVRGSRLFPGLADRLLGRYFGHRS